MNFVFLFTFHVPLPPPTWLWLLLLSLLCLMNPGQLCRDQNFGINELAAVQDVRNDFNLQDIADDPAVDRGKVLVTVFGYSCLCSH